MDMDLYLAQQAALIEQHGYTFVGVFDPDGKDPQFAYSIGLTQFAWPEVLFIGNMRPDYIEIILTDLINKWREAGTYQLGDNMGLIVFKDLSEHPLRVIEVDAHHVLDEYAHQVLRYFDPGEVKFVQVLWPDTNGKFPGEEGYDESQVQPVMPRKN
jgi:hypothetical protein